MNREDFYNQLQRLNEEHHNAPLEDKESCLLAIEKLLKDQLKIEPYNTELWLRLTALEYTPPLELPEIMISYLEKILEYDPENNDALILIAYINYLFTAEIPQEVFTRLCNLKASDPEKAAMIEYVKAFGYETRNNREMYVKSLYAAIDLDPMLARPYFDLGGFYMVEGHKEEGKRLLKRGLKNVQHIYSEQDPPEDVTDINKFYDWHLRGTHLTKRYFEDLVNFAEQ